MRESAGLTSLLLLVITVLPACKTVLDADGYEADDESFISCGEGSRPTDFRIRGCVNAISCNPNTPPYTISECLTYDPMAVLSGDETAYKDCDEYRESNAEAYIAPGKCSDDTLRCEDNIFYNCSTGAQIDCSKRGGTCHLWTKASGTQSGGCAFPSLDASCTATDTKPRCSGHISFACYDGDAVGRDCVKASAYCAPNGLCYLDSGQRCETEDYWCSGDTAFQCNVDGVLYERKCGDRGLTCDRRVGSVCVARGCSQQDFLACSEDCAGESEAIVCFGGAPLTIDCKAYGFARCQRTTNPDLDGLRLVRCVN